MDINRKKQLQEAYRNRRPEMGVISYRCKATGESFLGIATDTKAAFNSTSTKLNSNFHPNKRLLELWKEYGLDGFELAVIEVLEYDDPTEDHTADLEELREFYLNKDPNSKKIWR